MIVANSVVTGLPAYLGIRFVEMTRGPAGGRRLAVRDELLTPFKTLHGGVMAGLVDHVLGCVLYPLMPRGQWAATTEFKLNYLAPVFAGAASCAPSRRSWRSDGGPRSCRSRSRSGDQLVCVAQGTLLVSEPAKKVGGSSSPDSRAGP